MKELEKTDVYRIREYIESHLFISKETRPMAQEETQGLKYRMFERKSGLYQIQALRDIPEHGVRKGDMGGVIKDKFSLSQEGDAWVDETCLVTGNARVKSGIIKDHSKLDGDIEIENATISSSSLSGHTIVKGGAVVHDSTLRSTHISGGFVMDSFLFNCDFRSNIELNDIWIESFQPFIIEKEVDWKEVIIHIAKRGSIKNKSKMRGVEIRTEVLMLLDETDFKWCEIVKTELFGVGTSEHDGYCCEIKGVKGKPLTHVGNRLRLYKTSLYGRIKLDGWFYMHKSQLNGNIELKGNVELENTSLSDNAFIDVVEASLTSCTLSGCSGIKQEKKPFSPHDIEEISLRDDEIYVI